MEAFHIYACQSILSVKSPIVLGSNLLQETIHGYIFLHIKNYFHFQSSHAGKGSLNYMYIFKEKKMHHCSLCLLAVDLSDQNLQFTLATRKG